MAKSADLKDGDHGATLGELKCKPNEILGAFKKSPYQLRKARIV